MQCPLLRCVPLNVVAVALAFTAFSGTARSADPTAVPEPAVTEAPPVAEVPPVAAIPTAPETAQPDVSKRPALSLILLPLEANMVLSPGERATQAFEVFNNGSEPLFMSSTIEDWAIGKTGIEGAPAGTTPNSASSWIQLNPQQFVISPGQSVKVRYTVTAPAVFEVEHHSMIYFQSRPVPTRDAQNRIVGISGRVGGALFVAPRALFPNKRKDLPEADQERNEPDFKAPNANRTGRVVDLQLAQDRQTVYGQFENTSPLHYRLDGSIEALDETGAVLATGTLTSKPLFLPQSQRRFAWKFDAPLPDKAKKLKAVVGFGGTSRAGAEIAVPPMPPAVGEPQ